MKTTEHFMKNSWETCSSAPCSPGGSKGGHSPFLLLLASAAVCIGFVRVKYVRITPLNYQIRVVNLHQSARGSLATREKLSFMTPEHQSDSDGTGSGKEGSAAFQDDAHFSQHLPSSEGLRAGTGSHDFGFVSAQHPPKPFLGPRTLSLLPPLPPFSGTHPQRPSSTRGVLCRWVSISSSCSFSLWTPPRKFWNWAHSYKIVRRFILCILTVYLHSSLMWTHSYLSQTLGQRTCCLGSPQSLFLSPRERHILMWLPRPSTGKLPAFIRSLPMIFEIILLVISQILGTSCILPFTAEERLDSQFLQV